MATVVALLICSFPDADDVQRGPVAGRHNGAQVPVELAGCVRRGQHPSQPPLPRRGHVHQEPSVLSQQMESGKAALLARDSNSQPMNPHG